MAKARLFQFTPLIAQYERVSVGHLPRWQKFHLKSGLCGERSQSGARDVRFSFLILESSDSYMHVRWRNYTLRRYLDDNNDRNCVLELDARGES